MGGKVWVVGLDGSNVGYQALRLATMVMEPNEDKIEVLHISKPDDDGELATRLAHNAEIELRRAHVNPLRFKICTETLRKPRSCLPSDTRACTAAAAAHQPPPTRRHSHCHNRRSHHHCCRRCCGVRCRHDTARHRS